MFTRNETGSYASPLAGPAFNMRYMILHWLCTVSWCICPGWNYAAVLAFSVDKEIPLMLAALYMHRIGVSIALIENLVSLACIFSTMLSFIRFMVI